MKQKSFPEFIKSRITAKSNNSGKIINYHFQQSNLPFSIEGCKARFFDKFKKIDEFLRAFAQLLQTINFFTT